MPARHMGFVSKNDFLDELMGLFINHIDDGVVGTCLAVGTDKEIILCHRQALRGHGGADITGSFLSEYLGFRVFQTGNHIRSVIDLRRAAR